MNNRNLLLIILEVRKSKIKLPTDSGSGGGSFYVYMAEEASKPSWHFSYENTNTMTNQYLQAPAPSTIVVETASSYEFGGTQTFRP